MKNGKKLLRVHKELLKKMGHNPRDFLYIKNTPDNVTFLQRSTGKLLDVRR